MRTQKLSSGNFRIVISDGTDENGKRIFKSFTADAEWKAIKMAEDYKNQQKQPKTAKNNPFCSAEAVFHQRIWQQKF